jgi:hypothetical protein
MLPDENTPVIDFHSHFLVQEVLTNATAIRPLAASDIIKRPPRTGSRRQGPDGVLSV